LTIPADAQSVCDVVAEILLANLPTLEKMLHNSLL